MSFRALFSSLLALVVCAGLTAAAEPVPVIFDTDMGNDIDDALALAVLHALESRGEAKILGVTITKDNRWAAPYVDLVNTFYGRGGIPVGMVRDGKTPKDSRMIQVPAERTRPDGAPVYPRRIQSSSQASEAVSVLRRLLGGQPDVSVVLVQVGFSTNLARLLDSKPDQASPLTGRDLVAKKARLLSVMAGNFADGKSEFNVREDVPAARKVFDEWPTPIVASGFEIGQALRFPARSIENDFAYVKDHPVAEGYRNYMKMPYDRETWDLTSALYAVRPDRDYFSLSPPGKISALEKGGTKFEPGPGGRHRYLILKDTQKARTLEALVLLASQPPQRLGP
ncbi:MAG: nucleoside hydrolase [Bryobacterales bacterium]|nr:nucleoside hydrolase [Bryobacterales bacterium]